MPHQLDYTLSLYLIMLAHAQRESGLLALQKKSWKQGRQYAEVE